MLLLLLLQTSAPLCWPQEPNHISAMPLSTLQKLLTDLLHPDKNVRIEAALEIGKRADPIALPVLLDRLGAEPDFFVRENVTWAVVRMGDAAVLPVIALLANGDAAARFNAAHALSKLADSRAVPALLSTLDDPDPALVQKAAYALGRIRDARALPALVSQPEAPTFHRRPGAPACGTPWPPERR